VEAWIRSEMVPMDELLWKTRRLLLPLKHFQFKNPLICYITFPADCSEFGLITFVLQSLHWYFSLFMRTIVLYKIGNCQNLIYRKVWKKRLLKLSL
jgi:hypothetical protein